jgi:hypothetical protein
MIFHHLIIFQIVCKTNSLSQKSFLRNSEPFGDESDAWPRLPTSTESKDLFQQQPPLDFE